MLYEVITKKAAEISGGFDRLREAKSSEYRLGQQLEELRSKSSHFQKRKDDATVTFDVITSYSIHYTKLYERELGGMRKKDARFDDVFTWMLACFRPSGVTTTMS